MVAGIQGEGTCEAAVSPVAQLILSAAAACRLSIYDILEDFGAHECGRMFSRGSSREGTNAGVHGRAMARLRELASKVAQGSENSTHSEEWAHKGWSDTETLRGLLSYVCFAMPSPADVDLDADAVAAEEGGVSALHTRTEELCPQPSLLSPAGRLWLEGPLLAHILRKPAVGSDRPWVLRALQRMGLAVSVLGACGTTLDVAEPTARASVLLGIGQALLQFMAQSPGDAVRHLQISRSIDAGLPARF